MSSVEKPHIKIATDFAKALIESDFIGANSLISNECVGEAELDYLDMISPYDTPALSFEIVIDRTDWPNKRSEDLGWVYVAIIGEVYSEGVALIVTNENGTPRIRHIEWGRP